MGVRKDRSTNYRREGFTLEKGTAIYRTVSSPDSKLTSRHAYSTFRPKDAAGYAFRGKLFSATPAFNLSMKAKEAIIAPSKKERVDAFVKLISSDKKFQEEYVNYKSVPFTIAPKDAARITKSLNNIEKEYNRFAAEFGGTSSTIQKKYFNELKKRGFNAMIDDADAGVVASAPIIVFNANKTLEVISVNEVTRKYIKELKNRGG